MTELRVNCDPNDKVKRGEHKHLCECGTCWKHTDKVAHTTKDQFTEAHTCPNCGNEVLEKHDFFKVPPTLTEEQDMLDALDPIMLTGEKLTNLLAAHEIFEHERARILKLRDCEINRMSHETVKGLGGSASFADILENQISSVFKMAKGHNKELRRNKQLYTLACDVALAGTPLAGTPLAGLASEGFDSGRQLVEFDLTYARRFGVGFAYRVPQGDDDA